MTILLLNDAAYIRGGADRIAFDTARELAARGHRVILFTAFGPVDPAVQALPGVQVICLGGTWIRQSLGPSTLLRTIWNRPAAVALQQLLRDLPPADTVVHAHLYSSSLSASVLHAAVQAGFRTVLSLHDYFITCPNGAYFEFPRAAPCERRALSFSCLTCHCDSRRRIHKAWRVARTWLQNGPARLPSRLSGYIAVSATCAKLARRDLPPSARIDVIPNCVAIDRKPAVDAARHRSFVFSGRLESYKGPQLLAAAAARLNLPVVFCGTGPLERTLRQSCSSATFTGWLSPHDLENRLNEARVFVFPSVFRETFGLSAAEALARGLPVVASRGTAAEEFVHHERNGLLFAHNSVDELTSQLARLQHDDALVTRLATHAYDQYWSSPYTLTRHVDQLETYYAQLPPFHPNP